MKVHKDCIIFVKRENEETIKKESTEFYVFLQLLQLPN